jgi:glycosyltransferase involved in cell wall biosynthesis
VRVLHFSLWGQLHPISCGSDYVIKNQMSYFQERGWEVHCLVPTRRGKGVPDPKALQRAYPCVRRIQALDLSDGNAELRDLLLGINLAAQSPAFQKLAAERFDIFFANYVVAAPLAHALPGSCFKVVETIDLLSRLFRGLQYRFHDDLVPSSLHEAEERFVLRHVETELYQFFDRAIMISEDEVRVVHALGCGNARYVPQMFPVAPNPIRGAVAPPTFDLLFVGGDNPFNRAGLEWFVQQVYHPYLGSLGVRFAVAGQVCNRLNAEHPSLMKLGLYPGPMEDLYRTTKLVVVPILEGTGIAIKFCEALAAGRAVVTTPVGARGFRGDSGAFACIDMKANPRGTADTILDLLQNDASRQAMQEKARALMQERHSRDCYFQAMDEVFRPILEEARILPLAG